jgi:hypothetical protein
MTPVRTSRPPEGPMTGRITIARLRNSHRRRTSTSGRETGSRAPLSGPGVAQIHATLALAAATVLGTEAAEGRAWADVAGTKLSAGGP